MLKERPKSILLLDFDECDAAEELAPQLGSRFGLLTTTQRIATPASVRVSEGQQRADDLLHEISDLRSRLKHTYALGFTNADIFVRGLNFAFGVGSAEHRSALVSTFRLAMPYPQLFRQRVLKEAIHELGHVFGLDHCSNARCVMHFSNSIEDTDFKGTEFCTKCTKGIRI